MVGTSSRKHLRPDLSLTVTLISPLSRANTSRWARETFRLLPFVDLVVLGSDREIVKEGEVERAHDLENVLRSVSETL